MHGNGSDNHALVPFDDVFDSARASRGGQRRHRAMNNHSMMPFDPFGSSMYSSGVGVDPFGHANQMMAQMNSMMNSMMGGGMMGGSMMGGNMMGGGMMGGSMMGGGMMGGGMMMGGSMMGGDGGGQYQSQVYMTSSQVGPDGQQRVEKYANTTRGNADRGTREVKAAYSNDSGREVRTLQREVGERGRKVVEQRDNRTGENVQHDTLLGMQDDETQAFDNAWQQEQALLPGRRRAAQTSAVANSAFQQPPQLALQDHRHSSAPRDAALPNHTSRRVRRQQEPSQGHRQHTLMQQPIHEHQFQHSPRHLPAPQQRHHAHRHHRTPVVQQQRHHHGHPGHQQRDERYYWPET